MNLNYPPPAQDAREEREYTPFESVFAWLCVLFGYLFCRAFPPFSNPLGMFAVMLSGISVTALALAKKGMRFNVHSVVSAVVSLIFALSLIFTTELLASVLAFVCSFAAYCRFVYTATGNKSGKSRYDLLPLDMLRALKGFDSNTVSDMFRIMFAREKKGVKAVLTVILGFCAAIIPTAIVISLLSYDGGFTELLKDSFSFLSDFNPLSHLGSLILGCAVAMYVFGLYSVNTGERAPSDAERYVKAAEKARFAPILSVAAALLPLTVVYVFFFISQWQYYVSGFSGVLPEGVVNYAEYARSGFFELCAVSVTNFVILAAVALFLKREGRGGKTFLKVVSLLFSLMTLVLIGTAMAKMVLYINRFGLTEKRVLASWFMILLALVFTIIILRQFIPKLKLFTSSAVVITLMVLVLSISNYNALIADYNVDMYLSGDTESIDVEALTALGAPAVPAMARLANAWQEEGLAEYNSGYHRLAEALEQEQRRLETDDGIFGFSVPDCKARKTLEDYFGTK